MSVDTYVFLNKSALPAPAEWQAAISAHGFALELDTDFDPVSFIGFLPCRYKGEDSGFEYGFGPVENDWLEEDELARVGNLDFVVILTTRGGFDDLACALAASAALCAVSGGVWWDGDEFVDAVQVIGKTHEALLDLGAYNEEAERVQREWIPPNERDGGMALNFTIEGADGPVDISYLNSPRYRELRNRQTEIIMAAGEDGPDEAQMAELMELNAELARIRENPEG